MIHSKQTALICVLMLFFSTATLVNGRQTRNFEIKSPNESIKVVVTVGKNISYAIKVDRKTILKPSQISMTLSNDRVPGRTPMITDVKRVNVNRNIEPIVAENFAVIHDHYNELVIVFHKPYSLVFRVYNHGVAYRFQTRLDQDLKIMSEEVSFSFANSNLYFPEEERFFSHNERSYLYLSSDSLGAGRLASLPVLVETAGAKILVAESGLKDYPGMWLKTAKPDSLYGVFPHYPLQSELQPNSDRNMPVTKVADFIAHTNGPRPFPWRVLAIAKTDADLITNQLVFQLAEELQIEDPHWIKPGKVAWDWWHANNIYGVDFRAGINTKTYKHYIDFASEFGIEYIILDEGWYKLGNLLDVVPEVDVKAIVDYGKEKNVGVILWVIWKTLDDQLDQALDQFEKWGVAGIKVDFMQRDDQEMVNYYWKIADEAARRKLLVDFHGSYKPAGLRRAYPNVLTREGVKGLENNKWSKVITPTHDLTIPFIRMVTGPMDYTPGAMINAQPANFRAIYTRPMSMGTRAHQIAMYVIYSSPLQMMADSPSNYRKELECTKFIAKIPTIWHDTKVLKAGIGNYLVLARKHDKNWYIGAMTNESARSFKLDLSFLDDRAYSAEIIQDGINADRYGSDYCKITQPVSKEDSLSIELAPAGGWVAIVMPTE